MKKIKNHHMNYDIKNHHKELGLGCKYFIWMENVTNVASRRF